MSILFEEQFPTPYKVELYNQLVTYFEFRRLYQDKEGDIWIEAFSEKDLNELYNSFYAVLGSLKQIDQKESRVRIYFHHNGGKTYRRVINPSLTEISYYGKLP